MCLVRLARDGDDALARETPSFFDEGLLFGGKFEIQHCATSWSTSTHFIASFELRSDRAGSHAEAKRKADQQDARNVNDVRDGRHQGPSDARTAADKRSSSSAVWRWSPRIRMRNRNSKTHTIA